MARSSVISMRKGVLMWDLAKMATDGRKGLRDCDIFLKKNPYTCSTFNRIKIKSKLKAHVAIQWPFRCISHLASWTLPCPACGTPPLGPWSATADVWPACQRHVDLKNLTCSNVAKQLEGFRLEHFFSSVHCSPFTVRLPLDGASCG